MRKFIIPVIIVLVAAALYVLAYTELNTIPVQIITDDAVYSVEAEIADDWGEQREGLMGRWRLASDRAMLFVYEKPAELGFWMQNMRIPLDIWFIGEDLHIKHMAEQVPPCLKDEDCPTYKSPEVVKYVLEVQSGFAKRFDVNVGDRVTFKLPTQKESQ